MHEALTGTVTEIKYADENRQIIRLSTYQKSVKVLINKPVEQVEESDHVVVRGHFEQHVKFGEQFIAEDIKHCAVTRELIKSFLMSGSGIGDKTVTKLLENVGERILDILKHKDIDSLYFDGKISRRAAEVICHHWHKHSGKLQFIEFMNAVLKKVKPKYRYDLMNVAKKAFTYYGDTTQQSLIEDPYRLWAFGSFKQADILADALGVAKDDYRRCICAVEDCLYKQLKKGNTKAKITDIREDLAKLVGEDKAYSTLLKTTEHYKSDRPRIVITPDDTEVIEPAFVLKPVGYMFNYALPSAVLMENYVREQILQRINNSILPIQVTDKELETYVIPGGYGLSVEQQSAVKLVLENTISCVSGGAGTGKTSVMYCAHEMITSAGNKVLQVALSGKAARRLAQQTERDAMTIEKLLKIVERKPDYLSQFPCPLVLIDEASMVDLHTIYRLLKILENKPARIVFVGDWAQLPPVGPGLIYHILMRSNTVPQVTLTQNFRSIKGIIEASKAVLDGQQIPESKSVKIIQCEDAEAMKNAAEREYRFNLHADSIHVVSARLRTVADINLRLHETLTENRKTIPAAPQFRVGDAVVYKANDEDLGIVNGSTGHVIGGDADSIVVQFDIEGAVSIPKAAVSTQNGEYLLQHGYALTCHAAQGSEFDTVIIVVEDMPMVERSWLYTALTRAKKKAILITYNNSIEKALCRGFAADTLKVGFKL